MNGAAVERYLRLKQEIADLARAAGRAPDSVRLIAASKTHPAETLEPLIQAGLTDFGENTVQEALPKIDKLRARNIAWHFIGHLQSNKAKNIPGNFAWLHSLDSLARATRLERLATDSNTPLNTLIEINVTHDPRKHGVAPDELDRLLDALLCAELRHVALRGLMTIGPHAATSEEKRKCFSELRQLCETARRKHDLPNFDQLSMGMTEDYAEAIAEGATMVRIGTGIFGTRTYKSRPPVNEP